MVSVRLNEISAILRQHDRRTMTESRFGQQIRSARCLQVGDGNRPGLRNLHSKASWPGIASNSKMAPGIALNLEERQRRRGADWAKAWESRKAAPCKASGRDC